MNLEESATQSPAKSQRLTALEFFGAGLALLVLLDGSLLLRSQILGQDKAYWNWVISGFWSNALLFLVWVGFLIVWWTLVRKWSWQLLTVPVIAVAIFAIFASGIVPKLAWNIYQEPRFTEAAQEILNNPQDSFNEGVKRNIAGVDVYWIQKESHQVSFSYYPAGSALGDLVYRSDEGRPEFFPNPITIEDMGDNWWNVLSAF